MVSSAADAVEADCHRYVDANPRCAARAPSAANAVPRQTCQRYGADPRCKPCALRCLQQILPQAPLVLQVTGPLQPAAVGTGAPKPLHVLPAGCPYPAAPLQLPRTAVPHAQGCFLQLISVCRSLAIYGMSVGRQAPSRGARPVPLHSQGSTHVMQGEPCPSPGCTSLSSEHRRKGSQQAHGPQGNALGMPGQICPAACQLHRPAIAAWRGRQGQLGQDSQRPCSGVTGQGPSAGELQQHAADVCRSSALLSGRGQAHLR